MVTRNDRILEWAIDKVRKHYGDDVCLLVTYGSHLTGTETPFSDVDFYYVPRNERAHELCQTFVVEGIGYDLFPMSWDRLKGLARFDESLTPLLGDSRIVFEHSREEVNRFTELKTQLVDNLSNQPYMHARALGKVSEAVATMRRLEQGRDLCHKRVCAGEMLLLLSDAVAYENKTYFRYGLTRQLADLQTLQRVPRGSPQDYTDVVESRNSTEIAESCSKMLASARQFFGASEEGFRPSLKPGPRPQETDDFVRLAALYREIISLFNKIQYHCEQSNPILVFLSAVLLQRDLDDHVNGMTFDLLTDFDSRNLHATSVSAKLAEADLVSYISRGVAIERYNSVEEFLANN